MESTSKSQVSLPDTTVRSKDGNKVNVSRIGPAQVFIDGVHIPFYLWKLRGGRKTEYLLFLVLVVELTI